MSSSQICEGNGLFFSSTLSTANTIDFTVDVKGRLSVEDLGADSLDTVELVMALEEEFETEIPDEEAEKITTVQQAIDYIGSHVKK